MEFTRHLLWLPLVLLSGGTSVGATASPILKVIELLDGMLANGQKEKHEEQVQFAAYKQFCDDTKSEKKRSITEADESMEVLKADIQKHVSDAKQLTRKIASLDGDVAAWTGDQKAAAKVRQLERADYEAMHQDYSESVDALQRAIAYLQKHARDYAQSSLSQVAVLKEVKQMVIVSAAATRALEEFLDQGAEELTSAPAASGYEFQSGGIIDLLEKLLDKFISEKTELEKQEMNTRHAFEMLSQDLKAQLEAAKQERGEKAIWKAKTLQAKADAEGDLGNTQTSRDADDKYLMDLTGTCAQKASDFRLRQELRTEEIQAIGQALEILSSDQVKGAGERHLPMLQQLKQLHAASRAGTSLAQLRVSSGGEGAGQDKQEHAAEYLKRRGRDLGSKALSALAVRVADDPFGKVKQLIRDLITRLLEEANEEAEHKGWCDTEMSTNEQTRKEKTQAVEVLHAEIDQLQASMAKLAEDIGDVMGSLATLEKAMAKATDIRFKEKAENEAIIKDSQDAQSAVAQALAVLREFYGKTADAAVFTQERKKKQEPPPIFDSSYSGMQGRSGGVFAMLEVVQSDFARLEADTMASEAVAQKTYQEFVTDSKVLKAQKTSDLEHKQAQKQEESQALTTKSSDLQGTQSELDAALAYYDKLKPSCVDSGSSYDGRVTRRKEEIESLQEALRILNGEDIA